MITRDYQRIARDFEQSVLAGTFDVCEHWRQAIERNRRDLERQNTTAFPYTYTDNGSKVCAFIECLPHTNASDHLVGMPIRLENWQVWWIDTFSAWLRASNLTPRFHRGIVFMPKGNAKTTIGAGLCLQALAKSKGAAEIIVAANSREQAGECYTTAKEMMRYAPEVATHFGLIAEEHRIKAPTGAFFRAVSSDNGTIHGKKPRLMIADEVHIWPKAELYSNLLTMLAKRTDAQLLSISTAGCNLGEDSIGYTLWREARDILDGKAQADTVFAFLVEADPGLDWTSVAALEQANPNLGISVDRDGVLAELERAKRIPSFAPDYQQLRLNRWVTNASRFIDPQRWLSCSAPIAIADFAGRQAYIGVDLAYTQDLSAVVVVVPEFHNGQRTYNVFTKAYLPEQSKLAQSKPLIRQWAQDGWLTLCSGEVVDYSTIKADLLALCRTFPNSEVCWDPALAKAMIQDVTDKGIQCIDILQGGKTQTNPMRELEAAVLTKTLKHDGNPVMAWCIGNLLAIKVNNIYIKPDKETQADKIDCAVALLNALVRASSSRPPVPFKIYVMD